MLHQIIDSFKNNWINSNECKVKPIITYIRNRGKLREAQIDALETYLFLKIYYENKPLWQIVSEGLLNEPSQSMDIYSSLSVSTNNVFKENPYAKNIYEFTKQKLKFVNNNSRLLPELSTHIEKKANLIDFESLAKKLFYGIDYSDYLFSLPMGAGKTFLMASIIYLDLYFALNEPENKNFAHNFIILVPSGLKSSIIPSLKTIENFDPTWILPEPVASNIKRLLRFEVLDLPKSTKKSNRTVNPNADKVNKYLAESDLIGLVLVVNAEKVIIDRIVVTEQGEAFEKSQDLKDKEANELRNLIGKIPNLQILIDEVHHAQTDEIKLRKVVTQWNKNGSINCVLGFSGTPYLSPSEKINLEGNFQLKFSQITNTVFYYPLTTAIKKFLKKPRVEQAVNLNSIKIISKGVQDFLSNYENKIYENGTCAKLAIYCGSIEKLEEQIFPYLIGELKINPELILKYHRGNKKYKINKVNETEFAMLDTPYSKKKIILLVQIGKEGWDCRSLTSVILSQKGDCPTNMVLQTSCRCLRQVDEDNKNETALIWLNDENAKQLDKQLNDEQQTSIYEINNLKTDETPDLIQQSSRIDFLKLPQIEFYQMEVNFTTTIIEEVPNTNEKINNVKTNDYINNAFIIERGMNFYELKSKEFVSKFKGEPANFNHWLLEISKYSFNTITVADLKKYETQLNNIFDSITFLENNNRYYNDLFEYNSIQKQIRLAFHCRRSFDTVKTERLDEVDLVIIEKLSNVLNSDSIYPTKDDTAKILELDSKNIASEEPDYDMIEYAYANFVNVLKIQGMEHFAPPINEFAKQFVLSDAIKSKNHSFHYLPYNFYQSSFEMKFMQEVFKLKVFKDLGLEIYYNGDRNLTNFHITCYSKKEKYWTRIGNYTPDFLIINRNDIKINKVLILETKGKGFAEQDSFLKRKKFVESEFIKLNNEKFNFNKFNFLYLQDDDSMDVNLRKLNDSIIDFFGKKI